MRGIGEDKNPILSHFGAAIIHIFPKLYACPEHISESIRENKMKFRALIDLEDNERNVQSQDP